MPYGAVALIPGVNVEQTPTLLKAGVSSSQLIRYRDSLIQKLGGWTLYYAFNVAGTPRDLHAWEDLNGVNYLGVATTTQLATISNNALTDITPQILRTNPTPDFTTTMNSTVVVVNDPGVSNVTIYDSIYLDTPVSVGGIILSGLYPITQINSATSYNINAASPATSSVSDGGAVPVFVTTSGSTLVEVTLDNHGLVAGNTIVFTSVTLGNGVTIQRDYPVSSVVDANNFNITVSTQATASGSFSMNAGLAKIVYYIQVGPPAAGTGFGVGPFGVGGFGSGAAAASQQTGTEIVATDWTQDNWGEILLACPATMQLGSGGPGLGPGGIFQYDPTAGFTNAGLVSTAPPFNAGIFVSVSEQILVAYGSTNYATIGAQQDPLLIRWSTVGDYTTWTVLATNQAGSYRIPSGNKIMGGIAVTNQNLIWTDLDCWAMNYQGPPFVYGFNKIGAGAGLVSSHAAMPLRGNIYWMGPSNFYSYTSGGVSVLPCPVWDFVFQNLNTAFQQNVRAIPNTPFNEAGWEFPSKASTSGENDSYVKFNITEPGAPWDYGSLSRSAWIDQTVLGTPIGASPSGAIYQHETSNDAAGQPLNSSFTTGYFYIAEGEDFAFVDQILPDFKWGQFGASQSANIQMTFNIVNFPGDTPTVYGPYTVTQFTEILSVRFRGRQMSITIASSDSGSFWRIGKVRYRYAPSGRR